MNRRFLSQHDLIYDQAPTKWVEGIPLGNGDIGVMLWQAQNRLCGTLDKADVWERRYKRVTDPRYNYQMLRQLIAARNEKDLLAIFEQAYPAPTFKDDFLPHNTRLPFPRLTMDFGQPSREFSARLVLHDAVVHGALGFETGTVEWSAFVHAERNLFAIEFRSSAGAPRPEVRIDNSHFDQTIQHWGPTTINTIFRRWGYPEPVIRSDGSLTTYFQGMAEQGGYAIALNTVEEEGSERFLLAIASGEETADPVGRAAEIAQRAATVSAGSLAGSHKRFWHGYWNKSSLTIPDPLLENLYYAEMYKLGCCVRKNKVPCALQGVWTRDGGMPPWRGEYALNQNIQECYWPVYTGNHIEEANSLYERFWEALPRFQQRGRDFFGFEGAFCATGIDLWGEPCHGWHTVDLWPGAGAWLAHHYWLHWLYSQDQQFLRDRAYPFMRAFMQTYLGLVEKGDDGRYHLPHSHSPEYFENSLRAWGRDTTCDLYLMRWLATSLLDAVKVLNVDDPDAARWRDLVDHLAEPPQGDREGLRLFEGQALQTSMGLHAHLIGVYPLGNLTVEDGEKERDLIERSIRHLRCIGTGGWTGCHTAWMSLIASRARLAPMAWKMLQNYLCYLSPNTLHINGDPRRFGVTGYEYDPMTLDAGFCAAAAVMEMLLQSWGGKIRVFPAMPEFWHDACFRTLRAEGAFLVTARMRQREVLFVEIVSEAGCACRVANPFKGPVCIEHLPTGAKHTIVGETLAFETRPGDTFRLYPQGNPPTVADLTPTSPKRRLSECNWFGVKKLARF